MLVTTTAWRFAKSNPVSPTSFQNSNYRGDTFGWKLPSEAKGVVARENHPEGDLPSELLRGAFSETPFHMN